MAESITNELRDMLEKHETFLTRESDRRDGYILPKSTVDNAVDRIDEANEKAVNDTYNEGFDANLEIMLHDASDERLAKLGLVRLPVDKDGRAWHIGDRYIYSQDADNSDSEPVSSMTLSSHGWLIDQTRPDRLRHKPSPAERIRDAAGQLTLLALHPDRDYTPIYRELLAIANELEATDDNR